jgi:hypothetical protein
VPDRRALRELEGHLADAGLEGRRMFDLAGVAIYQLEPNEATAIACHSCLYVSMVPSLPKRSLVYACPRCGAMQRLAPPLEVMFAANRPLPPGVRGVR